MTIPVRDRKTNSKAAVDGTATDSRQLQLWALALESVLDLFGSRPAVVVDTSHDRYPDRGQRHLNDQLKPVNADGSGDPNSRGDGGANERRDDSNQQGEPEWDVLPTRCNDAPQDADDQANYQRSDDSGYFH